MDKKPFQNNSTKPASSAFIKGLRRINSLGKSALIHMKIHSLKRRIKDVKAQIGDYVFNHQSKFKDDEFISGLFAMIETYNNKILSQKTALNSIHQELNSLNDKKIDE
ncbi:MAG: hypothetical protein K9N09_02625 [Candidatus Cloacimonetes bacterium]|nr:hypothetical protein [Candidatus Cloacimonadota bacterium]MCF7813122.1 hypothetical protein [Candidatus Cloacimonadota bacterium]MCF7867570.1 hypothetical protein [Candidatus Cloacimonadota bacterium]MCF7883036.1 hypothetical protein [Candidatus Cloacimonadota bacterium]